MNKIVLVFAALLIAVSGFAQRTADIGIWGGTSTYFGDLKENNPLQPLNLNFGAYYRYNFNARVGFRAQFMTGTFEDSGVIEQVPDSFSKGVQDLSFMVEINFLKFILGVDDTPFTSYVMFGAGVSYFNYQMDPAFIASFNPNHNKGSAIIDESVVAATIPFGFGFKYSIGMRLGIGVEYQVRKMFSDKLDDLDDPLAFEGDIDGDLNTKDEVKYTDATHNNDWAGYLGLHITYKIYTGKKACAAYGSKN
jgi:hypothetical protein